MFQPKQWAEKDAGKTIENRTQPKLVPNQASKSNIVRGAHKYFASIVAGFFAGVAGELFVYLNGFMSPSALSVTVSAQVLIMVLVGAAGTLFGPMLGAVVFVFLQYVVSTHTERWLFVIGIIYVVIALYAPQGALTFLWAWWRRRTRSVA